MQTAQPIFQDVHGMAVKFFVQKDIAQEIQAEVCETITVRAPTFCSTSHFPAHEPVYPSSGPRWHRDHRRWVGALNRKCRARGLCSYSLERPRRSASACAGRRRTAPNATSCRTPTSRRARSRGCSLNKFSSRMANRFACTSTRALQT